MSENNSKGMTVFTIVTTIAALFLGVAEVTTGGAVSNIFIPPNTRFSCTLQPDTQTGKEIWTVMYSKDNEKKPWLRMVNDFGDNWNTSKRCDKIAQRLERFREDGLTSLSYRTDPNTPQSCNLLVTLKPGADGYESLSKMLQAWKNGNTVDQSSGDKVIFPSDSSKVNIENLLAPEDRKIKK